MYLLLSLIQSQSNSLSKGSRRNINFNVEKEYAVTIDNYTDTSHCKFYDGFGNRLYPCMTPGPFDEMRFCNFQYSNPNESYCNMPYTLSINNESKQSLNIFPNPTSDNFTIECAMEDIGKTIQLYDALGNLVLDKKIERSSEKINVMQFSSGIYSIRFNQNVYRLVIQN